MENNQKSVATLRCVWQAIKENYGTILLVSCIIASIVLLITGCDNGDGAMMALAAVVAGTDGGTHVVDGPLTTDTVRQNSNDLLLNEIDRHIVKIRPMATPIDQISRYAHPRHSKSMIVDYYTVDTKPTTCALAATYTPSKEGVEAQRVTIKTDNDDMLAVSDTLMLPDVDGYEADGTTKSGKSLVLYVVAKDDTGVTVMAVNGSLIGTTLNCVPALPAKTPIIRMGRAATELDVQTPQFESLPQKSQNYCQIFKMQVEQSTLLKIAGKEVDWTLSDQEEAAIYDMRLGMEKSSLFGTKSQLYDYRKKENVMLTEGIWYQAGKDFAYTPDTFDQDTLISMMRVAFTGNAGSKRKVLIGGSALIEAINKIDYTKVVNAKDTVTKWGIDFTEINSKFGRLYVLLSEVFDECGMESSGMIIDPAYLQKYSHLPFGTEAIDLKSAGVRNTDALVLTEASCLVLRYPKAHVRITVE